MINEYKSIQYKGKTVFAKAIFNGFQREIKYFTADESCFMFLSRGSFNLRTPDKIITFKEGDGMLAKCGNYFVERPHESDGQLEVIAVYFHPEMIKSFFPEELSFSSFKPNYDAVQFPIDEMLYIYMKGISLVLDNPGIVADDFMAIKIKELLLLLAKTEQAPNIYAFIDSLFRPYEYDFRETILNNSTTNLSLSELAILCNMSLATFKRRFKAVFGESPIRFLTRQKLEKAAEMLAAKSEVRVSDIVYDCGFDTIAHFNKVFKKYFGVSPTAYRLSQKEKVLS